MNWTSCKTLIAVALLAAGCNSDDDSPQTEGGAGDTGTGGVTGGSGGAHTGGSGGAHTGGSGGAATGGAATGGQAGGGAGGDGTAGDTSGGTAGAAGSGGGDAMTVELCLSGALAAESKTERIEFSGEGVSVGLVRFANPDMAGTSGTTSWLMDRFAIVHGAEAACVTDIGAFDYQSSYHNFDDSLTVTLEGTTYTFTQVRAGYETAATFTVSASGNASWGPITLTLVSCAQLDTDDDCANRYQ